MPPSRQQLLGSVLWQAAGDAIGFLVEGRSAGECAAFARQLVRTGEVIKYGLLRNVPVDTPGYVKLADAPSEDLFSAFGQYTDDTQVMRELLKSLASSGGQLDCGDFAQRVARLFQDAGLLKLHPALPGRHGIVGCGSSTRDAAQRIADGDAQAWHISGRDSPGNGGCMRAGPLGVLFFGSDDETVATVAALQAHPTHARLEVKAAAAALVAAVRYATGSAIHDPPTDIDPPQFCSAVAVVARVIHADVATAFEALPEALELPADQMRAWVVRRGVQCRDDMWDDGSVISSSAVQAVLWAVGSFLRHVDSPLECLCAAIEGGGDTDTTAAMAGAISGARCGAQCMPEWLSTRLTDRGRDNTAELTVLVDELVTLMHSDDATIEIGGTAPEGLLRPAHEVEAELLQAAQQETPQHAVGGGTVQPKRLFDEI